MTPPEDNDADRRALQARRESLLARQAEQRRQRQRVEAREDFERWHRGFLQQAGVRHVVHWDPPACSPLARYPMGFSSVDWERVPGAVRSEVANDRGVAPLVDAAFAALVVAPSSEVWVDWGVGTMPWLAMSAVDLATHVAELSQWSSDLWIYDPAATWLIEIHHEGRFAYAPRPAEE